MNPLPRFCAETADNCNKNCKKKKTAKILLLFLFGQHATTLSLNVPHYNSPSRSFKASDKFESIVASYIRLIPAFDVFFLIAKLVSYEVNHTVALKRSELF